MDAGRHLREHRPPRRNRNERTLGLEHLLRQNFDRDLAEPQVDLTLGVPASIVKLGVASPGAEDVATTAHLARGANVLSPTILDHLIVTRDERLYDSMADLVTLPVAET
jgi:hypothetical protein